MKLITDYLFGLRKYGKEPGVIRAERALEYLGHPEEQLSVIHVAGTNGKGSVCAYISKAMIKSGFNVGVFTSPHLIKVNERIRINGRMISDEEFKKYFRKVKEVSDRMEQDGFDSLAFFDYLFVMAVLYFADMKVDYVVLETGLGGKKDATAAIKKKLVSVITSISYDHTEILGETLAEIALEKAGIISQGTPVVYWRTNDEVAEIIENRAKECGALSIAVDKNSYQIHNLTRNRIDFSLDNMYYKKSVFSIGSTGTYQVMNASIALTVLSLLNQELITKKIDEDIIREGIFETYWEGRMEEVENNVFLDGAHNPDGIKCFLETAARFGKENKIYLLFGAVCEKDYQMMIQNICNANCFAGYVITEINNYRMLSAKVMAEEFSRYTDAPVYVKENNEEAYNFAKGLREPGDVLMCAGSLYLVGALKELLSKE